MIATTIEQSKRLLEAGIDTKTADMYYKNNLSWLVDKEPQYSAIPSAGSPVNALEWYNKGYTASGKGPMSLLHFCFPAWSLSALIRLCPEHVPYRIIRTRGKDIEGIFEDCVTYLCKKK